MQEKKRPQRRCIACGAHGEKRDLIRFVKTASGVVELDESSKKPGRGAYVCASQDCFLVACQKRAFNRALKTSIGDEEHTSLQRDFDELCAKRAGKL